MPSDFIPHAATGLLCIFGQEASEPLTQEFWHNIIHEGTNILHLSWKTCASIQLCPNGFLFGPDGSKCHFTEL